MMFSFSHKPNRRTQIAAASIAVLASVAIAPLARAGGQAATAAMSPGDVEMMNAMEGMKPATDTMRLTGNLDRDFMLLMISHHDAGIAMSSAEVGYGEHSELKKMATGDVADQQKDNRDMREYLKQKPSAEKSATADAAQGHEMIAAMQKMNQSMNGIKLTGDQDHDFIMMMIPHHEAAITMSQIELKYGADPRVKKVAQGVFDGQSKDVKDMKVWHKDWFGESYPM